MPQRRKKASQAGRKPILLGAASALALAIIALMALRAGRHPSKPASLMVSGAGQAPKQTEAAVFATYGKSPSCKSCHEQQYKLWESSHHALAERALAPAADSSAFEPAQKIRHGSQRSEARLQNSRFQLTTIGI